jgi:hypothetical protein
MPTSHLYELLQKYINGQAAAVSEAGLASSAE